MSLRSDCLLAITGLFPDGVTPREHAASVTVPDTWAKRLRKWVTAEQGPFTYVPPKRDMEKLFSQLVAPLDTNEVGQWIEGIGIDDVELSVDYPTALMRARKYLADAWPKFSVTAADGARILPLSADEAEEMSSILQVLNDPEKVLDEMFSWTLTADQALAFRTCYPDLYAHADNAIVGRLTELRAKDPTWEMGVEKEAILNLLRGQPPEEMPPPPPEPPTPAEKVKLDPDRDRTQAEVSSAPKERK